LDDRRRAQRRHLIHYLGAVDGETGELIGRVVNISSGGVMVVSGQAIETEGLFRLRLVLPVDIAGSGEIPFDARSVWCSRNERTQLHDTGFELLDVTQKDIRAIESLIEAFGSIPESETIRVLYMEDDPGLARLFQKQMTRAGYHVDIATDGESGMAMFRSGSYDALAVDQTMPGPDGLDVIRVLGAEGLLPATVMVSGSGDESVAVEAMKLGADDYVVKDSGGGYLKLLPSVIEQALRRRRVLQDKISAEEALRESESKMSGILSSMDDSVFVFDAEGRITDTYPPDAKLSLPSQYLQMPMSEVMPEGILETFVRAFDQTRHGEVSRVEFSLPIDDEETWFSVNLSPMLVSGEFSGAVAVLRDITELIAYREQLRRANERLEERVQERTRELREAQAQLLAQQRLQQEMKLAAEVQTSLLPHSIPTMAGFDIAVAASPAHFVSGDFYDFISQTERGCCMAVADISGKGVPAALLTSTARTLLRAEATPGDSLSAILERVSRALHDDLVHAEMFITVLLARLDAIAGTVTIANAGHTDTLWWRHQTRSLEILSSTGLPVGILEDAPVSEQTITLQPGDILVAYSDGITEAASSTEELFGLERLKGTVAKHADASADDLTATIVDAVMEFGEQAPLSDDLTLIVVRALPRAVPFAYPGTLEHLDQVVSLIRELAGTYGGEFASQVELAASEIVTNIMEHAYRQAPGELRGQVSLLPGRLELDLYDQGESFDLTEITARQIEETQERGRGLEIVRQLMDEVSYTASEPNGNHWRLVKLAAEIP